MALDFVDAFKRPFSNTTAFLIGIFVAMIPLVNIVFYGYVVENIKNVVGNRSVPNWSPNRLFDLLIQGLTAIVAALIYFLPTIILALISMVALVSQGMFSIEFIMNPLNWAAMTTVGVLVLFTVITYIISMYFFPAVIVRYAAQNDFGAIFELDKIAKHAFTTDYFIAFIVTAVYAFAIGLAIGIPLGLLGLGIPILVPIISFIVTGITTYITFMTASTLYAQTYRGG